MKNPSIYLLSANFKKDHNRFEKSTLYSEKYQISFQKIFHFIFLVLFSITSSQLITGQVTTGNYNYAAEPLGTPSLLSAPNVKKNTVSRNFINSSAQDTIREIFQKLVNARGNFRMKKPEKIYLRDEVSRVASIDYDKLEIVVEQKAYDVCKTFGESAVAFLIGHELTHYYEKHAWRTNFGNNYASSSKANKNVLLPFLISNESQADYLGGFLAYSAGYGMFDKGPQIIQALYDAYQIQDPIEGYPPLADRKAQALNSAKKLESLVDVFDMGNYLSAIGKYEDADAYYTNILMQYQSREIFNNCGLAKLLNVVNNYFTKKLLKYDYALVMDLNFSGSRDVTKETERINLLKEAIVNFDAAVSLDPNYAPAYLNKATAFALLGDTTKARFFVDQEAIPAAEASQDSLTLLNCKVLQAILYDRSENTKQAKKILQAAQKQGSTLATSNLNIINGNSIEVLKSEKTTPQDTISGYCLSDKRFKIEPAYMPERVVEINGDLILFQFEYDTLDFKIMYNLNHIENTATYFMLTKDKSLAKTNKKIGIGNTIADIVLKYGVPIQNIEAPQGKIMVYNNLLFIIDEQNKVKKWASFVSQKVII